ncbi:chain-length determining protein [Amphritea balenae]|nr:chain-length determining protein [Amphritea balenae]GGK58211.1 capsule polysaccharide export inner-membrane protein KpsE [Amphritea balenae]
MLLLRDYLLSVDMMNKLEEELDFRAHYSKDSIDLVSRLSSADVSLEELHEYYLKRIQVELDEYAQVLRIKVEAFSPEMAYSISNFLLSQGEAHMNSMGQRLAQEQVSFLQLQVSELSSEFDIAQQALINYQNEQGLVSPTGTVESLSGVVANLEGELSGLKIKKASLLSFQSKTSPEMVRVQSQIDALSDQIAAEQQRMAKQSGNALNVLSIQYQVLELKARFAQESYSAALVALEGTRIEAARKLKQVSVLQQPTYPEYAIEPRRLYNTTVFAIIMIFLSLIMQMLILIIKDHRD